MTCSPAQIGCKSAASYVVGAAAILASKGKVGTKEILHAFATPATKGIRAASRASYTQAQALRSASDGVKGVSNLAVA